MLTPFSHRIGNLELRSTCARPIEFGSERDHVTAEIIQWVKNDLHCHTIAYWLHDQPKEVGYELKFISDRPMGEEVNWDDFRKLVGVGYLKLREASMTKKLWEIVLSQYACKFRGWDKDKYVCANRNSNSGRCARSKCPIRSE